MGTRAAEDFAFGERADLRDEDFVALVAEEGGGGVEGGIELNRTHHCDTAAGFEIP